nr:cytidine deaminase [Atopobacter phocae]
MEMEHSTLINEMKLTLVQAARDVLARAYAPYSKFPVGAALLMKDGSIITGVNVENASFGVTNCAERTAIFTAVTQGYEKGDILAVAVAGKTRNFLPPCSVCRQVMVEFCGPETPVFLTREDGEILEENIDRLVPYAFVDLNM